MSTHGTTPPTDLELMMLSDGVLDASRRVEVEAYLATDVGAAGRGKLEGLRAVSALVGQTGAWPERPGIDVVDSVFAAIDAGPAIEAAARVVARELATAEPRTTLEGAATSRRSSSTASGARVGPSRPANDNGRYIYGLAFAAAAAAAALFVWGKGAPEGAELEATRALASSSSAEVAAQPSSSGLRDQASGPTDAQHPDAGSSQSNGVARAEPAAEEPRYGVEVASVDFGQRTGAIYYVPSEGGDAAAAAVTTVVWLADE